MYNLPAKSGPQHTADHFHRTRRNHGQRVAVVHEEIGKQASMRPIAHIASQYQVGPRFVRACLEAVASIHLAKRGLSRQEGAQLPTPRYLGIDEFSHSFGHCYHTILCDLEASRVYEDERVLAFMSLEQPNPYKVLVVPRIHVETLYDLDDALAAHIFQTTVHIARAIRAVSRCPGLNLAQANGKAGQQDVFHVHLHLIPRLEGDSQQGRITLDWDNTIQERDYLDQLAAELRSWFVASSS